MTRAPSIPQAVYGSGYYTYPCASAPTISFSFGGATTKWIIGAPNFNLGTVSVGSTRCVGAIIGADVGVSGWILGDTFMGSVYTTFGQLLFALDVVWCALMWVGFEKVTDS